MFTIIGAMAELERNVIRERVVAGMEYARRHGTKSGKAIGRPKRVFDRSEVIRLRHAGLSIEKIAYQMRIGVGTVARVISAQGENSANLPKGFCAIGAGESQIEGTSSP
jgi:DNA invertase Pin-like site-specific DNA recombinase